MPPGGGAFHLLASFISGDNTNKCADVIDAGCLECGAGQLNLIRLGPVRKLAKVGMRGD